MSNKSKPSCQNPVVIQSEKMDWKNIGNPKEKDNQLSVTPREHHKQSEFCTTRASYRQGKEYKAVKVFTVNDESQHLLVHNVPSMGFLEEIRGLANKFGRVEMVKLLPDYPVTEEFTHVYYVKYKFLGDARQAKKKMDNRSFFGNILHVCYAPELESVEECRKKIQDRINYIQKSWKSKSTDNELSTGSRPQPQSCTGDAPAGMWSNLIPSSSSVIVLKK